MQQTALGWLTWRLTESPQWLGAVGFATQVPILVFGLLGGVLADKLHRYRLVMINQSIAMFQAIILAVLTLTGVINIGWVFVLAFGLGLIMAFDYPARQSFLMDLVGQEDVGNAVALTSSLFHFARVVGPMLAGFIVAKWGEGVCFAANAMSFVFVLTGFAMMRRNELGVQEKAVNSVASSIAEALKYVWHTPEVRRPLTMLAAFSFAAMPYIILLPDVVGTKFHGGAETLGFAMGMAGVGAVIGAVMLAVKKMDPPVLYRLIKMSMLMIAVSQTGFAMAPTIETAFPALIMAGFFGFLIVASNSTTMQVLSPPPLRGRVMSIFTITFFGSTPLGSLFMGWIASHVGASTTIAIGGFLCAALVLGMTVVKTISLRNRSIRQ